MLTEEDIVERRKLFLEMTKLYFQKHKDGFFSENFKIEYSRIMIRLKELNKKNSEGPKNKV